MSSDYEKGYRGEPGVNNAEYQRGQQDSDLATPRPGATNAPIDIQVQSRPMDTGPTRRRAVQVGILWAKDPNGTVKAMLRVLFGFTVAGGVLGFALGTWLHNAELWLIYAKVLFWFAGFMITMMILGVTLAGAGTKRGTVTLLFLGGTVAFMAWTYVLYPVVFIHFR